MKQFPVLLKGKDNWTKAHICEYVREYCNKQANHLDSIGAPRTADELRYLPETHIKAAVDTFFEIIEANLMFSGKCQITNMFTLLEYEKNARPGRNPKTGEVCTIPAKQAVRCRFAKKFGIVEDANDVFEVKMNKQPNTDFYKAWCDEYFTATNHLVSNVMIVLWKGIRLGIYEGLEQGRRVTIREVFQLWIKELPPRIVRNPNNGVTHWKGAEPVPVFKVSDKLRQHLDSLAVS